VAIALGIFALVGISGSITQCVPMALAFQIAAAEGGDSQGNAIGAISIAIVMPQVKIARQRLVSAGQLVISLE
jgi:hypothetical protein